MRDEISPGTVIGGFSIKTPVADALCSAQVAETLKRRLPEAVIRQRLIVVANGPSAKNAVADHWWVESQTLALNGALKLFLDQDQAPTYWACCDPQALVADFLPDDPPEHTTYLVASKCHPAVFEKLKHRKVLVWHLPDYPAEGRSHIAQCSSVTLSATWLMHRLGFTDFEYWGWDGCFMDGRDHANGGGQMPSEVIHINYGGKLENGEVIGGQTFQTTRTWAAEAKGAEQFFQLARYFDIGVTLHGGGMFKAAQELILAA